METEIAAIIDELWSRQTLYQVLLGSAFVAAVINVTWFVISGILKFLVRRANRRVKNHTFILGQSITRRKFERLKQDILGFHCLIVRYGTDDYLRHIASDQDRYEGRLQLKIRKINIDFDNSDRAIFSLKLPIHKRLGTQFKCFVVARSVDRVPAVISILKGCEHVSDVRKSASYFEVRIYFLVNHFTVVETITPNLKNNYIFPE
jgi:hypothetical protein